MAHRVAWPEFEIEELRGLTLRQRGRAWSSAAWIGIRRHGSDFALAVVAGMIIAAAGGYVLGDGGAVLSALITAGVVGHLAYQHGRPCLAEVAGRMRAEGSASGSRPPRGR